MLDGIDDISREIFDDTRKYSLIKCGLYFHNCKTKEARNFLNNHNQLNCIVFGNDYLNKNVNIEQFIPLIKIGKNINSNQDWLLKFKNWISPPLHSIQGRDLISENDLDEHQKKYVRSTPNKIQKVSGVAGCGKTKIIAIRAASLAATEKKVLVVCFNITQRNYLKEFISRAKYLYDKSKIDVFYFQDFCQAYREDRDIPFPESTTYTGDKIEDLGEKEKEEIINDKENHNDLSYNYDAILVDEGQDFQDSWFKLLRCFLNKNGEMLIAIDDKQNIYNRKKPTISGIGPGRWGILKKSYRLLNEHIDLANRFSEKFLSNLNKEENPLIDKNTLSQKSLPFDIDPFSKWINVSNIVEARDEICKILDYLQNDTKTDISDIVILVSNHDEGIELKQQIIETFPKNLLYQIYFIRKKLKFSNQKNYFQSQIKSGTKNQKAI